MINSFNTNIAVQYGVNISIFCQELAQWTFNNLANRKNIHDGLCWSFNTYEAYSEIFPYWSKSQLETVFKASINAGLVKKGNYNKNGYDRTCWYALTYEGLKFYPELITEKYLQALYSTISEKSEIDFLEFGNRFPEFKKTIPTNNTTNNLSKDKYSVPEKISEHKKKEPEYNLDSLLESNPHNIPQQMLEDWLVIRKDKKARVTKTAWSTINKTLFQINESLNINPIDAFGVMVSNCWQSLKLEWFNKSNKQNDKGTVSGSDDTTWGKDFYVTNTLGFYHE
jgi:hypothetical protein